MTELGVGYISIVGETSKLGPSISSALNSAQAGAEKSGQGMGSKLARGLGASLKVGALAAGSVAGAVIGTALTQGMGRLVAIDDAKGKLSGLGHDAQSVATIMDSALASVKGTAYGLGDAATIAASAVAAGIKPGEELQKYLSLTGDAATIAGTSLEEMGSVFNKVQTSGTAFTDNLNQLSDRGIPIFQWLQDEYGVSADALSKMVKAGEVDSETFKKVIEENIGGAALESGKTLRGSYENTKAALGRAGASAIEPFLPMIKDGLKQVTSFADKVAPQVEAGAKATAEGLSQMGTAFVSSGESIDGTGTKMERLGARLRMVTDGVQGVWSILAKGDFAGSKMTFGLEEDSKAVDVLFDIREGAISAYDALSRFFSGSAGEQVASTFEAIQSAGQSASTSIDDVGSVSDRVGGMVDKLTSSAASLGGSLIGLGGDTATVVAAGVNVLGSAMGFAADNADLLGVALGGVAVSMAAAQVIETGYQAARIANAIMMPAQIAAQMALTRALISHTAALRADITANGGSVPVERASIAARLQSAVATRSQALASGVRTAALRGETTALGAFAAAQRTAAASSTGLAGAARSSVASVATLGARAQGVATGGLSALRTGAGKVSSFMGSGGGFMIGLAVAIGGVMAFKSSSDKMSQGLDATRSAASNFSKSMVTFREGLDDAFGESGGVADKGVKSVVTAQIEKIDEELDAAADRLPGKWDKTVAFFQESFSFGQGNQIGDLMEVGDSAKQAERAKSALDKLGLSNRDLAAGVTGSGAAWRDLDQKLRSAGGSSNGLVEKYSAMRRELVESQSSASQVKDAFADIATSSVGAAGGVDALTGAMGRFRGDQMTAEETQKRVNDALRGFTEASAEGAAAVDETSGKIDTTTAAGSRLFDAMKSVQGAFDQAGAQAAQSATEQKLSAEDAAIAVELAGMKVRDEFIRQRVEAGWTEERAIALADAYGLIPMDKTTTIKMIGDDQILTRIGVIQGALDNLTRTTPIINAPQPNIPTAGGIPLPGGRASGGRLPTTGPGTDRTDGFLAVSSAGVPVARVDAGEWVVNERSSDKYDRELAQINAGTFPKLPGYEDGGRVGVKTQQELLDFVNGSESEPLTGAKYVFGGIKWGDCSSAMSAIARFAVGLPAFAARFATATMDTALASLGFSSGRGGPNDLRMGWRNGGPGGGHALGTLPGGTNVEMGGSYGGGMVGGVDGADAAENTDFAYLPIPGGAGPSSGSLSRSSSGSRKRPEWTDKQQLQLEEAAIAITRAEEARAKVEAEFAEGKKSEADLDMANKKVEIAQQKVTDLQAKKDEVSTWVAEGPAPQAPELSRSFSDAENERIDAQVALDSANTRRNEVYDDPDSTDVDKLKADAELDKARKALALAGTNTESGDTPSSWSDLAGSFARDFISGQVEEALGVLGIPNELPSAVKAAQMLGKALANRDAVGMPSELSSSIGASTAGSPTRQQMLADSPVVYDPSKGPEQWVPVVDEALRRAGSALSTTARTVEQIGARSGGDPANLWALTNEAFAANRDPSLPNDPQLPLSNLVAGLRSTKGVRAYHFGGDVTGPSGRDQVPALLEAKEYVVNSRSANAADNPAILRAMNSGTDFRVGQQQSAPERPSPIFNIYAADQDDAIRRWKVAEMVASAAAWGTL
ncbi:hypothetical protein CH275_15985 [Rhodococcus sp. 06-235-1A]|uniref:tape measure protein n=1 Tax=Rhodococcus sp. 06-235-1A TaxID=2022508 RepID=UPI000B9B5469|nr:tape measure protein [Rhodococcus sp. 06-235-1A]OZD03889.1 hypothetical protein CH275_15985 [Rhodococcus sp. 06-235-1A]